MAIHVVGEQLQVLRREVTAHVTGFDVVAAFDELLRDFDEDGPLWTRVDGKRLAGRISVRLGRAVPKGGLMEWSLKQVEEVAEVPAALVADLQALINATFSP